MIQIDKKIPIPNGADGKFARKYPFPEMKVGDSFLFPPGTGQHTARSGACQWGKKSGRKFIVRTTKQGLRCWRVE